MKRFFSIIATMLLLAGFTACEPEKPDTPPAEEPKVVLHADRSKIEADGVQQINFVVFVNGEIRTSECQVVELESNTTLEGYTFTTTVAGEYRFVAKYDKYSSEEVIVTATEPNEEPDPLPYVELTADKSSIVADGNDMVTFTVTADGVDVTAEAEIVYAVDGGLIGGNTFTTTTAGTTTFKALYGEAESNEVTITATAQQSEGRTLTLTASTSRIKADGQQSVTFEVMCENLDVSTECTIRNITADSVLDGISFTTTEVGSWSFVAEWDGLKSNTVSVESYKPAATGKYEPCTLYDEGGVKGVIYAIDTDIHGDTYVYLMSLDEEDLQWSTEYVWCNCGSTRGDWNTEDMLRFGTSPDKYPAAQWCVAHGEGWFMPSAYEMELMWEAITDGKRDFQAPKVAEYNALLEANGGEPFCETFYWTSNETTEELTTVMAFMDDSVVCLEPYKDRLYTVRAAYRFLVE